jgi:hypothetical protein
MGPEQLCNDSVLMILTGIWSGQQELWSENIVKQNTLLNAIDAEFSAADEQQISWNECRDNIRTMFNTQNSVDYPMYMGTDVMTLARDIGRVKNGTIWKSNICENCGSNVPDLRPCNAMWELLKNHSAKVSDCAAEAWYRRNQSLCRSCGTPDVTKFEFNSTTPLVFFNFADQASYEIDYSFTQKMRTGTQKLTLAGVVYFGGFHFTARMIDKEYNIWKYDGMAHHGVPQRESTVENFDWRQMNRLNNRRASLIIYYAATS